MILAYQDWNQLSIIRKEIQAIYSHLELECYFL